MKGDVIRSACDLSRSALQRPNWFAGFLALANVPDMTKNSGIFRRLVVLPAAALLLMANTVVDQARDLMSDGKEAGAFALIEKAAQDGDPEAINYLAWFYDNGRHVDADAEAAMRLYRQAAREGVAYAQWRLGVAIDKGETDGKLTEAVSLFRAAADQEFTNAMTSLAVMHATGRGTPLDAEAARELYFKAGQAGNAHAIRGLGVLYLHGEGVEIDPVEAAAYFLVSASRGNEEAAQAFERTAVNFDQATFERAMVRATEVGEIFGYTLSFEPASKDEVSRQ